ncbi:NTP transferase domain-containing protein [Cyanobacteria bacterium FACHB-472]|nr:NTP transferase domain-containing protein [Cyanobacteria bacterium FACHB-472]
MKHCKTSLMWRDRKNLLSYQVEGFLLAGITPIVVLGSHNWERRADCLPGSLAVINNQPSDGKISSILTGLKDLPRDFHTLAISAVDQPRPAWIYQKLLQASESCNAPITAPIYQGKMGHPLFFSPEVLPSLENLREESFGLRQVIQDFQPNIQQVEFDTTDVLIDLNTPESYQAEFLKLLPIPVLNYS